MEKGTRVRLAGPGWPADYLGLPGEWLGEVDSNTTVVRLDDFPPGSRLRLVLVGGEHGVEEIV